MNWLWPIHLIYALGLFVIGTVVGSFLNVCIYRIPWEKSVIWPGSHCPHCLGAIASRDNIPIFGWIALRGACRRCGSAISPRYPLIELLVGLLFVAVYLTGAVFPPRFGVGDPTLFLGIFYHVLLVALLVAVTFIDYDLWIVPPAVTNTGIILGLALGALFPQVRPVPAVATTMAAGLMVGIKGLLVGGLLIGAVRFLGGIVFRREAMGSGDIHILAMIGAFLGWQAAVLTFFIAPFIGFVPALSKYAAYLAKRLRGRQYTGADREIPFGPYLSMAAVLLLLSWPWFWPGWAKARFEALSMLFLFLVGQEP